CARDAYGSGFDFW
nr:immunoglobulin heavy chain junction region [Macaca mulatta]MOV42043.1 immunoglobulin heavy chain junction region [Macaca mulatta]MOW88176.1 immunoglobulin heavy chain junction region [Macaca mulatta]MOW88609.1 immunoglobulin heavy chain junction region [Macaca mulatta]MOW88627.1 immunoglobulin heavy chain junction region [Macaca mulatta]